MTSRPPEGVKWYYSDEWCAIANADCRDVLPLLPKVDLVLTDPPYGLNYASNRGSSWQGTRINGDNDTSLRDWLIGQLPSCPMYIFGSWKVPRPVGVHQVLIWDKGPASGMGDLSWPWKNSFEEIYVLGKGFTGKRDEAVIKGHIQVSWESGGREHPNQKPVSLMKYLILKTKAQLILDPFLGSGTTCFAAKQLGRKCIGIEIEERYCEIAARRLSQGITGLEG